MRRFRVQLSDKAVKMMSKLDFQTRKMITNWLRKNLEGCENPRQYGRALRGNHQSEWRYRIGNYRVLADIQDETIIILVLEVGHRRNIY